MTRPAPVKSRESQRLRERRDWPVALGLILALMGFSLVAPVVAPTAASAVPAGNVATTMGMDFWVAVPPNMGGTNSIYLAASADGSATVTIPGLTPVPFSQTVTLTAGAVSSVDLPLAAVLPDTTGTVDRGVRVTSTVDVALYGALSEPYASSGYLGMPITSLGTSYRVLSYVAPPGLGPSYVAVVASADGTAITVTPRGAAAISVTLNEGQVYQLATQDATGATVTSNNPVSVFGGVKCVYIPTTNGACNPIVQQLPPVDAWGSSFLSVRFTQRARGDTYRVLANEDNTDVSVNGAVVVTLAAGSWYEAVLPAGVMTEGNQGTEITASKPVLVAQYGNGQSYDGSNGDPLMMLVPPYQQFLNTYLLALPNVPSMSTHFLNLVTPTTAIDAIRINGGPVDPTLFAPIGSTGWSGAQIAEPAGTYALTSPQAFGVDAYEWGTYDGIGFVGGMAMAPIGQVGSVTLSTSAVVGEIGKLKPPCATATVLDGQGQPMAGVVVQFAVTGAGANNQVVGTATDSSGVSVGCLPGTVENSGLLSVSAGSATASATVTWTSQLVVITSLAFTTFEVGTAGTFTVTTTGSPIPAIAETGALPAGVTLVDNLDGTATLSGTPTAGTGGQYPLALTADNGGTPVATQVFALTVNEAPSITLAPASVTVQMGQTATFTAAASGYPAPTAKWQRSTDAGATFADIPGETGTTLTFPATAADDGAQYRAEFTNSAGTIATTAATLTVTTAIQPVVITSAASTGFPVGVAGTFTVTTSGLPVATITASGALPAGVTFVDNHDGTATLSGTPGVGSGGQYPLALLASNGAAPDANQAFILSITEAVRPGRCDADDQRHHEDRVRGSEAHEADGQRVDDDHADCGRHDQRDEEQPAQSGHGESGR